MKGKIDLGQTSTPGGQDKEKVESTIMSPRGSKDWGIEDPHPGTRGRPEGRNWHVGRVEGSVTESTSSVRAYVLGMAQI